MLTNDQAFWRTEWARHMQSYVNGIPRQAYYLDFVLGNHHRDLLEIGAGSFRDTARLNEWGYQCTGTDFSEDAVEMARESFPECADRIRVMDATSLEFEDKSIDVSFHNGFYVLFDDDDFIRQLLVEQIRVTRHMVVCTVHNALNERRVAMFREKAREDPLYDIRFFTPFEIGKLLEPLCSRVDLLPFGQPTVDRAIHRVPWKTPLRFLYNRFRYSDFSNVERVMAIGYLD